MNDFKSKAVAAEHAAAKALEAILVKQVLVSSGAFKGTDAAGSSVTHELFAEQLAQAISNSGGFGIGTMIERALHDVASPREATPPRSGAHFSHITSDFGTRADPFTGKLTQHTGLDLGAPLGTPIPAAREGVVTFAGVRGGYGNAVEVAHADGTSTLYAHASTLLVKCGQRVSEGESLALVGQTGRTTGPHLHLEVREGGRAIDPHKALKVYRLRAEDLGGDTR